MRDVSKIINEKFGAPWSIGDAENVIAQYGFVDGVETIKTHVDNCGILDKKTVCVNGDGERFEVTDSRRKSKTIYIHTLAPLNTNAPPKWEMSR